ncbi:Cadherin-10 [Taenia solium]|eukprot:TsM_000622500 transcript=TsM_000622500 gene=TsM_000622500
MQINSFQLKHQQFLSRLNGLKELSLSSEVMCSLVDSKTKEAQVKGTVVGQVKASDADDGESARLSYEIQWPKGARPADKVLTIDRDGNLTAKIPLDRESAPRRPYCHADAVSHDELLSLLVNDKQIGICQSVSKKSFYLHEVGGKIKHHDDFCHKRHSVTWFPSLFNAVCHHTPTPIITVVKE